MKFKYIKSIVSAALFLSLTTGITSCINDLDISPIDPQMTATFDQDMYFTKLYASLGLTGQKLSEDPDIAVKDEGQSCFYRALFTNNEYGTDEMIWTWQENAGIPELTYMRWNSSHQQIISHSAISSWIRSPEKRMLPPFSNVPKPVFSVPYFTII